MQGIQYTRKQIKERLFKAFILKWEKRRDWKHIKQNSWRKWNQWKHKMFNDREVLQLLFRPSVSITCRRDVFHNTLCIPGHLQRVRNLFYLQQCLVKWNIYHKNQILCPSLWHHHSRPIKFLDQLSIITSSLPYRPFHPCLPYHLALAPPSWEFLWSLPLLLTKGKRLLMHLQSLFWQPVENEIIILFKIKNIFLILNIQNIPWSNTLLRKET